MTFVDSLPQPLQGRPAVRRFRYNKASSIAGPLFFQISNYVGTVLSV